MFDIFYSVQVSKMSGKTEILYEPDTDIDIKEFKLETIYTDIDAIAGGEDFGPLNTDQESQGTSDEVKEGRELAVKVCIHVISVNIQDQDSKRIVTKNLNMKGLDIPVISVNVLPLGF